MEYEAKIAAFGRLIKIMDDLRTQCPWDKKQTIDTLRNLTIEETYELVDAIDHADFKGIKEEIGDLMLHMVFYAKIAEEKGEWGIGESLDQLCEKLIARHPHIYGDITVSDDEEVKRNWEKIKMKEGKKSLLQGVPAALPALVKAYRLQEKTKQVGFEWENSEQVWAKVEEELNELQDAVHKENQSSKEEEFGDLLFALVNYARFENIDPEQALERTNRKFKQRFEYIEKHAMRPLTEMSLVEMDVLWNEAKRTDKNMVHRNNAYVRR